MSDDATSAALHALSWRTPLEDSLLGITAAMSGHPGGDAVLREIGVLLRRHSRRFTVAARDRGDDLTIVLPNTPRAGAVTYAERIKAIIESHPFEHGTVTASLGVAALPESVTVPEELIGGAYQSVADAKRHGGNRVAVL